MRIGEKGPFVYVQWSFSLRKYFSNSVTEEDFVLGKDLSSIKKTALTNSPLNYS